MCKGALLLEDGCNFTHGKQRQKLLEVSADGYSIIPEDIQGNIPFEFFNTPATLEIKCHKKKSGVVVQRYTIPKYDVIQILTQIKAKGHHFGFYTSWAEQSFTVILLRFNVETWEIVWSMIEDLLGSPKSQKPSRLDPQRDLRWEQLEKCISDNSVLLGEFPSLRAKELSTWTQLRSGSCFYIPRIRYSLLLLNIRIVGWTKRNNG